MSQLTAAQRRKLPKKDFAGPDDIYPVEDWTHAANAKSRAKQQLNRGKLSREEYEKIVAKANRVMGRNSK